MHKAVAAIVVVFVLQSCAGLQKCQDPAQRNTLECAVVRDVVDCTTANATSLIGQFKTTVAALVAKYTGTDGAIDWNGLGDATKSFGIADGECVLADVIFDLMKRSSASGDGTHPKYESLSLGFDQLRSKRHPGVRFHTPDGDL